MMLGIGFSYRWFALRIGAALIGNSRPVSKYGKAKYFDIGTQFSIKKVYSEIDLRNYSGYVVKNAFLWDSNYSLSSPNDKQQDVNVYNVSAKMWYLHNKHFRMDPFINNKSGSLVPPSLHDSTNTKVAASALSAIEFGVIPGFSYVNRIKKIQFGFMAAAGPRLQIKSYNVNNDNTGLASIVARYDFKAIIGYNVPRFFAMMHLEVDNKSIHFEKFKYNQTFFYFKIQTGYRFKEKIPKKFLTTD